MGRSSTRLPSFCLNRFRTRVRVRSPPIESKPISATIDPCSHESNGAKQNAVVGRRIMVVVDSSREAKAALQWALSHTVQSHDIIVLLDVVKPTGDQSEKEKNPRSYELLYAMRKLCQAKKPEVQVELSLVEGKERGPTIVYEAERQGISLLILCQKKRSVTRRLMMMWTAGRNSKGGVVDYCIQNATCMTLAVRKKSKRGGGYLITSKRHKDFWLLA